VLEGILKAEGKERLMRRARFNGGEKGNSDRVDSGREEKRAEATGVKS